MFQNYLAAALRNLAHNWVYAAISVFGLAISFSGAILVAQFVRNEFTYDRWIPDYQNVYKLTSTIEQPGQAPFPGDIVQASAAQELEDQFPGVVAAARVRQDFPSILQTPDPGDGGSIDETFAWVDADYFTVFPLPAVAGDLSTALEEPDSVVLTRSAARKYFGREDVMGETLTILQLSAQGTDRHSLKVSAILDDYPSNTTLVAEILASGKSSYAPLARLDAAPPLRTGVSVQIFVRVKPGVSEEELQTALDIVNEPYAEAFSAGGMKTYFGTVPLSQNHLTDPGLTNTVIKPTGKASTAWAIAAVGALIVIVAGINFVTLMTARASRRAVEVGIRKANGATRSDLVIQFMGEALIYAVLSMILAVIIASLLAPGFSDFVQRGLTLDFLGDPALTFGLIGATLVIGLLGGFYPALVLSSFRPGAVLNGGQVKPAGSPVTRQSMVVVQFAILMGLIIATVTIYQQTRYALAQGLGSNSDLIMQIRTNCANAAFLQEVRKLPGVERAACSSLNALSVASAKNITQVRTIDARDIPFDIAPVHFEFFETYDIEPLAGRVFERDRGAGDNPPFTPPQAGQVPEPPAPRPVILNETAIRALGYETPEDAVGKQMFWSQLRPGEPRPSEIIGVVPDIPVSVGATASPAIYFVFDNAISMLSIKATGENLPGTVEDIQRVWKDTNNVRPIQMNFYSDYRRIQYLDIIIQGTLIGICAGAAVVIACLGLFALSAFAAERRIKEIGVRKALGATTNQVLALLMWQFTIPVLIAIAIALPVGWIMMSNWLQGFVYRVQLTPWTFALAAGSALAIAWITVSVQTYLAARAKPARALRHE